VIATFVSAVFLFPLLFLVLGALRAPGASPPTGLDVLAPAPDSGGFERAFALVDLGRQLLNSALVAAIAVPLTVLVASWAGFAATRLGRFGRRLLIGGSLIALLVPLSALWVPRFVLLRDLGPTDFPVLLAGALVVTRLSSWRSPTGTRTCRS